jgi:phosphate starvation-inducible protein PhoH
MPKGKKKQAIKANASSANIQAIQDHQCNKSLSFHDLKVIKPLTQPQKQMMESFFQGFSILAMGSAGTGKSLISLYLALNDVLNKNTPYEKIKIIRSVVPSREIGYLPGDLEEKIEIYEAPYQDLFTYLLEMPTAYEKFKKFNTVEFLPTSFLRGQTWDNTIVVADEVQNMNFFEINTIMTRIGNNSKILLLGDTAQTDLYKNKWDVSGIKSLEKAIQGNRFFDTVHFTKHDIVRSEFVKSWICSVEDLDFNS